MKPILLVASNRKQLVRLRRILSGSHLLDTAASLPDCVRDLKKEQYDLIFLDAGQIQKYETILSLMIDHEGLPNEIPTIADVRKTVVELVEKSYLEKVLSFHSGRINKTSVVTGISSRQLRKLMTKYNIRKENFKK